MRGGWVGRQKTVLCLEWYHESMDFEILFREKDSLIYGLMNGIVFFRRYQTRDRRSEQRPNKTKCEV